MYIQYVCMLPLEFPPLAVSKTLEAALVPFSGVQQATSTRGSKRSS